MKELGITKGEWVGVDYAGHYSLQVVPFYGARDLLDEDKTNEAEANMQLCCDAGNTAQKCGLLPSELLQQRDELKELLKAFTEGMRRYWKDTYQEETPDLALVIEAEAAIKNTESLTQKTEGGKG